MKRILSLILTICMIFCMALPAVAMEIDVSGTPSLVLDSGVPEDVQVIGESDSLPETETSPLFPAMRQKPRRMFLH